MIVMIFLICRIEVTRTLLFKVGGGSSNMDFIFSPFLLCLWPFFFFPLLTFRFCWKTTCYDQPQGTYVIFLWQGQTSNISHTYRRCCKHKVFDAVVVFSYGKGNHIVLFELGHPYHTPITHLWIEWLSVELEWSYWHHL